MNFLSSILVILFNVLIGVLFHELGHYLVANANSLRPKFGFDSKGFYVSYKDCSVDLRKQIILSGVMFGFIPVVWVIFFYGSLFGLAYLLVMLVGSLRDLETIRRIGIK